MANKEIQVMYSDLMDARDLIFSLEKALMFLDNKSLHPTNLKLPIDAFDKISKFIQDQHQLIFRTTPEDIKTIYGMPFEISKKGMFIEVKPIVIQL